jgi:hypothetical protein
VKKKMNNETYIPSEFVGAEYSGIDAIQWFQALSLELQIVSGILFVLLMVGIVYLTIQLIRLVLWITYQLIKINIAITVIYVYSIISLFIILPIDLLFKDKRLSDIANNYGEKVKKIFFGFYPKLKKKTDEKPEQSAEKPEPVVSQPVAPVKTIIAQPIKFHCSSCGAKFTPTMKGALTTRNQVFCEQCGQGFSLVNQVPQPVYSR